MTLNQLVDHIQELGEKHWQIKKTYRGNLVDFLSLENLYPAMNFDLNGANITGAQLTVNFALFFMDRVAQDQDNEMEVLSDQVLIAQDIIAQLRYPGEEFEINDNVQMTFFVDDTGDFLAGVRCDISINLGYISDRCQVPSDVTYA